MVVSGSHKAMDTEFRVSIVVDSEGEKPFAESAAAAVFERIDSLERLLSRFEDTSDVAMIRALPPGEWGELVITTIGMEALPLIRYRTGDYTRILPGPCLFRLRQMESYGHF